MATNGVNLVFEGYPSTRMGTKMVDEAFNRIPVMVNEVMFDVKFSTWREDAACVDVVDEVSFFLDPEDLAGIARAKAVCATCPVAAECLTWSIETHQTEGVWGGHTPKERRSIRRRWMEEIEKAS